jgi:hypothetical protein
MGDRAPSEADGDQLLARDDVILAPRDPGDRSLHRVHNRSCLPSPPGTASFFTSHVQKLARAVMGQRNARFCRWSALHDGQYSAAHRPKTATEPNWNGAVTQF